MSFDASKALVATPAYDGVDVEYVRGVLELANRKVIPEWLFLPGQADIRLVRNLLAHHFLKTGLEHLVFIDADIGFTHSDWRQLSIETPCACLDFARKEENFSRVVAGLAFCRIDREVLECLKTCVKTFFYEHYSDPIYDFFESGSGIVNGENDPLWSSEARCFWARVSQAGFKTAFVRQSNLVHYGRYGYKLEVKKRHGVQFIDRG